MKQSNDVTIINTSFVHHCLLLIQICHPSELGLGVGDKVSVEYLGMDSLGKHQISRKTLLEPLNPPADTPLHVRIADKEIQGVLN